MNVPRWLDPPESRLPLPDAPSAGTEGVLAGRVWETVALAVVVVVRECGGEVLQVW